MQIPLYVLIVILFFLLLSLILISSTLITGKSLPEFFSGLANKLLENFNKTITAKIDKKEENQ